MTRLNKGLVREAPSTRDAGPPYTIETLNKLTGTRQHRKGAPYPSLEAALGRATQQAERSRSFATFNVLDKRGDVVASVQGSADDPAGGRMREVVADFNTLDDLVAHAQDEGATHVLVAGPETKIYFRRGGEYPYEAASVRRKGGYWHADGPGHREGVKRLPASAEPLAAQSGRRAAETHESPRSEYTTKQSAESALRDYVFRDGTRIGHIDGPYSKRGRADFYRWWHDIRHMSGEAPSRQSALNTLIRADKQAPSRRGWGSR